jgi:hypothetical protein
LTCPPEYGYGAREIPGAIPANSKLIFEVEVVDFHEQDTNTCNPNAAKGG